MLGLETPLLLVVRLVEGKVKRENEREGGREKEERGKVVINSSCVCSY